MDNFPLVICAGLHVYITFLIYFPSTSSTPLSWSCSWRALQCVRLFTHISSFFRGFLIFLRTRRRDTRWSGKNPALADKLLFLTSRVHRETRGVCMMCCWMSAALGNSKREKEKWKILTNFHMLNNKRFFSQNVHCSINRSGAISGNALSIFDMTDDMTMKNMNKFARMRWDTLEAARTLDRHAKRDMKRKMSRSSSSIEYTISNRVDRMTPSLLAGQERLLQLPWKWMADRKKILTHFNMKTFSFSFHSQHPQAIHSLIEITAVKDAFLIMKMDCSLSGDDSETKTSKRIERISPPPSTVTEKPSWHFSNWIYGRLIES